MASGPVTDSIVSCPTVLRTCCPAITTSGLCEYTEFVSTPIALPVPAAACRFTSTGTPSACA